MQELEYLYQELILDHSKRPIGKGASFAGDAGLTGSHREYNPSCGDEIELKIAVSPDSGEITELTWDGQGCSISTASASILAQLVRDQGWDTATAEERIGIFRDMLRSQGVDDASLDLLGDAIAFQGVSKFVMRIKCAMLAWVALEASLKQVASKRA